MRKQTRLDLDQQIIERPAEHTEPDQEGEHAARLQFFLRAHDADVIRYLKIFTFLPMERIEELERSVAEAPERREAQETLAEELTRAVHGEAGLAVARKASQVLFGGSVDGLAAAELEKIFANVASATLAAKDLLDQPVADDQPLALRAAETASRMSLRLPSPASPASRPFASSTCMA